jgi:hypothetical protein
MRKTLMIESDLQNCSKEQLIWVIGALKIAGDYICFKRKMMKSPESKERISSHLKKSAGHGCACGAQNSANQVWQ